MAYMYARMMKQIVAVLALLAAALALSLVIGAAEEGWRLKWVNPREETGLPNTALPLYRMYQTRYAEEDGGYTFTVYFKKSPKIWYLNSPDYVNYSEEHAVFARRIVEAWNASIRFAAENYEWARHLSKLRLKFYTDENVTQAPHVDVVSRCRHRAFVVWRGGGMHVPSLAYGTYVRIIWTAYTPFTRTRSCIRTWT
jgi:hypothetical protein